MSMQQRIEHLATTPGTVLALTGEGADAAARRFVEASASEPYLLMALEVDAAQFAAKPTRELREMTQLADVVVILNAQALFEHAAAVYLAGVLRACADRQGSVVLALEDIAPLERSLLGGYPNPMLARYEHLDVAGEGDTP